MNDFDLNNLIFILSNLNSPDESIRSNSEAQINQMLLNPPLFLDQLLCVIQSPNIQHFIIQISHILISQILQVDSSNQIDQLHDFLIKNPALTDSLKTMLINSLNQEDMVIKNLAAKIFAILFQILNTQWIDVLSIVISNINDIPNGSLSCLKVFSEILELKDYELCIFVQKEFITMYMEIFKYCINFIGTDRLNNQINIDIRLLSAKCIVQCFHQIPTYIINPDAYRDIIDSLQYSFPIADINLFQALFHIMKCMITSDDGYLIIDEFLDVIFKYSLNSFSISNPLYIETVFSFWGEVAHFEYKYKIKYKNMKPYKSITKKSANSILNLSNQILKSINLPEILDSTSPMCSLAFTIQETITNYFKCAPKTLFQLISSNFPLIIENGTYPFPGLSFISSISIKTNHTPFSEQFLLFIHSIWPFLLSFENQANSAPEQSNNENFVSIRITALSALSKLIKTFPIFANMALPYSMQDENKEELIVDPIRKLDDIFTLIKNNQLRQKDEHPAVLTYYSRLIGSICEDRYIFSPKQIMYIESNFQVLSQYLWSLFDLNYNKCLFPLLLEETTINMNRLIYNSVLENQNAFNFLASFFTYCEEKLNKSGSLLESENIRYIIQKSLCSFIGTLGNKMATDNDVCKRSFESLLALIKNPNKLIYEEALMSIGNFIPRIHQMIDQNILMFLVDNAMNSIKTCSNQMIMSGSTLLASLIKCVSDRILNTIPDAYFLLKQVLFDHPELRESHFYVLNALYRLFKKVSPQYTLGLKDDFLSLIEHIETVINVLNLDSKDDLEYANLFYEFLSKCYCSYVNAFIDKPNIDCPPNMFAQERKNLIHLATFASYINQINNNDKTDELLLAYADLVEAITKKCSRTNNTLLNKAVIRKPIEVAQIKFYNQENERGYKRMTLLLKQMMSV